MIKNYWQFRSFYQSPLKSIPYHLAQPATVHTNKQNAHKKNNQQQSPNNSNEGDETDANMSNRHPSSLAKQRQAVGSGFFTASSKCIRIRISGKQLQIVKRLLKSSYLSKKYIPPTLYNSWKTASVVSVTTISTRESCYKKEDIKTAFDMSENCFCSKEQLSQAPTYLKRLTFKGIKIEKSWSDLEALSAANERIFRFLPQCSPSYQGTHQDGHKTEFLADIVDREESAQHVLTARITAQNPENEIDHETF